MPFSFSVWAGLQTFIKTPQHQATLGYDSREAEDGFENIVTEKEAAKTAAAKAVAAAAEAVKTAAATATMVTEYAKWHKDWTMFRRNIDSIRRQIDGVCAEADVPIEEIVMLLDSLVSAICKVRDILKEGCRACRRVHEEHDWDASCAARKFSSLDAAAVAIEKKAVKTRESLRKDQIRADQAFENVAASVPPATNATAHTANEAVGAVATWAVGAVAKRVVVTFSTSMYAQFATTRTPRNFLTSIFTADAEAEATKAAEAAANKAVEAAAEAVAEADAAVKKAHAMVANRNRVLGIMLKKAILGHLELVRDSFSLARSEQEEDPTVLRAMKFIETFKLGGE